MRILFLAKRKNSKGNVIFYSKRFMDMKIVANFENDIVYWNIQSIYMLTHAYSSKC